MIKKIFISIAIFLGVVFFAIYCYVQARTIFESVITTQTAVVYTTQIKSNAECYLLRDEIVIKSSTDGVFNYLVDEGDKLRLSHPIAEVYSSEHDLEIHNKVKDINERIRVLESSSLEKSYLRTNVSKLDSEITDFITLLHSTDGEYSAVVQNKNDFLILMNKRNLAVRSEKGYTDLIKELKDEKDNLTKSLSEPLATVYSPTSGFFYSSVDGYESIFNSDVLKDLTVDSFFDMINNASPETSDMSVGKIVDGFEWYTLCVLSKEESVLYDSGHYYDLIYPYSSGLTIRSYLESKITQADRDEVILVFKTDKVPEKFNFLRRQKTQIIRTDYTGLRVSKEALRIVDGYEGVYVLVGNVVKFKRCDKICENDGYYIINVDDPLEGTDVEYSYLRMYDSVITVGKELYDGKMIG